MEKQICLSLVYQHLLRVSPGLAEEFDDKYKPEKALVKAEEVLARWEEEQLARIFVFNHLKEVAPALVEEFKDAYFFAKDEALLNIESMWTNWDEEKLARQQSSRQRRMARASPVPSTSSGSLNLLRSVFPLIGLYIL